MKTTVRSSAILIERPVKTSPSVVSREEDLVTIRNCPPKSALKRFKLETVLKSPQGEREAARTARLAAEKASSDATPVTKGSSVLEALKQSRPTA